MFKWLLKKYYPHSPICNCGWAMKPFDKCNYIICQWKCVWYQCNWECFQDDNGRLHWWKAWQK